MNLPTLNLLSLVSLCFIFSGCSNTSSLLSITTTLSPQPNPSSTSHATQLSQPSPTFEVVTLTPIATFNSPRQIRFEHAGFIYSRIEGYSEIYRMGLVVLANEDQEVHIGIAGGIDITDLTLLEHLESVLSGMATDIEGFTATDPILGTLVGIPFLSVDISGILFGVEISGRVAVSMISENQYFVIFGNAPTERWFQEGLPLFNTLLESLEFFPPTPLTNGCPVSSDQSYGFTQENPIRIGEGDAFSGPYLEVEYLDQLQGPNGEYLT